MGLRSAQLPGAVAEGKLQAACAFAGAKANATPLFGLSALPFLTGSAADAQRLLHAARPAYAAPPMPPRLCRHAYAATLAATPMPPRLCRHAYAATPMPPRWPRMA